MDKELREKFQTTQDILKACADIAEDRLFMQDVYALEVASGVVARYMYRVEERGSADL